MSEDKPHAAWRGFVAGTASGVTKLVVGHPFDTIKVRMQVDGASRFRSGVWGCVKTTFANEGIRGFYKGATPPLIGWACMDSLLLGSLDNYRALIRQATGVQQLSTSQHSLAGLGAGLTVAMLACPIEHVKARLQVQYDRSTRKYNGPIDCARQLYRERGIFRGLYHGLGATLVQRSWFCVFWGTYDVTGRYLRQNTNMSASAISFWAGGAASQSYWIFSFPFDVAKQAIFTDNLSKPAYHSWIDAMKKIAKQPGGARNLYRGFLPCFLRAIPTNGAAVAVWEFCMHHLP